MCVLTVSKSSLATMNLQKNVLNNSTKNGLPGTLCFNKSGVGLLAELIKQFVFITLNGGEDSRKYIGKVNTIDNNYTMDGYTANWLVTRLQ